MENNQTLLTPLIEGLYQCGKQIIRYIFWSFGAIFKIKEDFLKVN